MDELGLEAEDVDYTVGDDDCGGDRSPRPKGVDLDWFELCEYPKPLLARLAEKGCQQAECFLQMATYLGEVKPQATALQAWFRESKVVDANGDPKVMVHGTPHDFSTFRKNEDYGIWFSSKEDTSDAEIAMLDEGSPYGEVPSPDPDEWPSYPVGGRMIPVYLRLENPFITRDGGYPDAVALAAKGHDGVLYLKEDGEIECAVVFDPLQIKSALGNCGTFDPNNPDLRA